MAKTETSKKAVPVKTMAAHPGDKVEVIDTHDRIEVIATEKHFCGLPGTIRKVHPKTAQSMFKNGTAKPVK